MNKVQVVITAPEPNNVKRGERAPEESVNYVAAFHKESVQKRNPIHLGPTIAVNVVNDKNKIIRTDVCSIVVVDKGGGQLETTLRRTESVECSAELE